MKLPYKCLNLSAGVQNFLCSACASSTQLRFQGVDGGVLLVICVSSEMICCRVAYYDWAQCLFRELITRPARSHTGILDALRYGTSRNLNARAYCVVA
jgi:hypothetical protein